MKTKTLISIILVALLSQSCLNDILQKEMEILGELQEEQISKQQEREAEILEDNKNNLPKPSEDIKTDNSSDIACTATLSITDFEFYVEEIEGEFMPQEKLKMAKNLFRNICLKSSQVRDIVSLFSMSEPQLSFAKYAYRRTIDKENYRKVVQVISTFSQNDLRDFLEDENPEIFANEKRNPKEINVGDLWEQLEAAEE